ncbi:MAG: MFS transporter [Actinomycetota bacterium]|nr:MFS transporter [Actinomycetota bacterium]
MNESSAAAPSGDENRIGRSHPVFGSPGFLRLWVAQVVSAFGDWIGFLAIIEIARRLGGGQPGSAIALVMLARVLPGFFLASVGGVIVDRVDRKRLLITCDILRAGVLLLIPLIERVWALVLASLVLELATSLWGPAKEAIVPNLVPKEQLTAANSLSLVAAYGTFPLAAGAFIGLAKFAEWLGGSSIGQVEWALALDAVTFLIAAGLIATLPLLRHRRDANNTPSIDLSQGVRELREGWTFIAISPQVRAVLVGLGTGMIGGGMLIPLGAVFNDVVLGAGNAGFGTILVTMGLGVAAGVSALSAVQRRLDKERTFVASVFGAGTCLLFAVTSSDTFLTLAGVFAMGVFAGSVYVLGFTLLHENVEEQLRGRVFSALYTLVRFCLLLSITVGGFLSDGFNWLFDVLFDNEISVGSWAMALPGVRGALWLASTFMLLAGALAWVALRAPQEKSP